MRDLAVIAVPGVAQGAHRPAPIVVNCAGIAGSVRLLGRDGPADMARLKAVIRVNLPGTASVMARAAARMMVPDRMANGMTVTTSPSTACEGQIGQGAYVAARGAIAAMTCGAAREFAARGLRVLAIAPVLWLTPMVAEVPPDVAEGITMTPFSRAVPANPRPAPARTVNVPGITLTRYGRHQGSCAALPDPEAGAPPGRAERWRLSA